MYKKEVHSLNGLLLYFCFKLVITKHTVQYSTLYESSQQLPEASLLIHDFGPNYGHVG